MLSLSHSAASSSFTRDYIVASRTNRSVISTLGAGITPANVDTYFDKNGNQLNLTSTQALAWNEHNNIQATILVKRDNNKNDAEYYVYDSSGARVRKVNQTYGTDQTTATLVETIYLGGVEIRRTSSGSGGSTSVTEEYHTLDTGVGNYRYWIVGTPPVGISNPCTYYTFTDHLGSCTLDVDTDGKVVTVEEYTPYAMSCLSLGLGAALQLKTKRYSGKELDATGLYYYGARYLSPTSCRWMSPDPVGPVDGLNIYLFLANDPINSIDDNGNVRVHVKLNWEFISKRSATNREKKSATFIQRAFREIQNERKEGEKPTKSYIMTPHNDIKDFVDDARVLNTEEGKAGFRGATTTMLFTGEEQRNKVQSYIQESQKNYTSKLNFEKINNNNINLKLTDPKFGKERRGLMGDLSASNDHMVELNKNIDAIAELQKMVDNPKYTIDQDITSRHALLVSGHGKGGIASTSATRLGGDTKSASAAMENVGSMIGNNKADIFLFVCQAAANKSISDQSEAQGRGLNGIMERGSYANHFVSSMTPEQKRKYNVYAYKGDVVYSRGLQVTNDEGAILSPGEEVVGVQFGNPSHTASTSNNSAKYSTNGRAGVTCHVRGIHINRPSR